MAQRQWRSDDTDKWLYGFGDGSDGDLTISADTTEAPIDSSCSGTSGTTSLSATNASFAAGQLILIHQTRGTGVGGWELNRISSYTAGTITLTHALTMTYTDSGASQAQVRVMKQYNSVTIDSTKTYTAKAWGGDVGGILGWFAKTGTTVTGSIYVTGKGYLGGTTGSGTQYYCGEGTAAASYARLAANGNGGGGAGYTTTPFQASGAGGGHLSSGNNGAAGSTAIGGSAVGNAGLTNIFFGGGGGVGWNGSGIGSGGNGGGICLIFSKSITIGGSIASSGNSCSGQTNYPGGAGAGGSVLLKCQTAILGTSLITSSAGSTGTSGSVGRIHIDYSGSYTGTTTPTIDATNDTTIVQPLAAGGAFLYNFI